MTHGTYALTKTDVEGLHRLIQGHWSAEQIALIRQQIAPKATPAEMGLFLTVSRALDLDPLAKQIYAIHRKTKVDGEYVFRMTIQIGIDGYRAIADKTGEYVGNDDPAFEDDIKCERPEKATVTVWRRKDGERCPFTASARWPEYYPNKNKINSPRWEDMPYLMLGKCAEALALRKAFPSQLSGIYTDAEMDQADEVQEPREIKSEVVERSGERVDSRQAALDEIEELLKGPCADIEEAVREEMESSGKTPEQTLKSVKAYMESLEDTREAPLEPDQRRETQAPKDRF